MMFERRAQSADAGALEGLTRRVETLEGLCQALAEALEARSAEYEKLRLDHVVLGRRLDEAQGQSNKAVTALFDRIEALRAQLRTVAPSHPPGADVSANPSQKDS